MSVRTSILLPLLWAKTVQAAEPTPPTPAVFWADERILSVSGGISRGAYQAGQLYVLTSWLRQQPVVDANDPPHVVFSGSSAGSINALLGALTLSSLPPLKHGQWEAPEASAFFRTWVPLGFDMTARSLDRAPDGVDPRAYQALINQPMLNDVAKHLGQQWQDDMRYNYKKAGTAGASRWKVDLMLTAARQQPALVPETRVTHQVTLPFGFHLTQNGSALAFTPTITGPGPDPMLYTPAPDLDPPLLIEDVTRLVVPSSSIPGAFPIYDMDCDLYDRLTPPEGRVPCGPATSESVIWMIDGGTLEGNPIRVAHKLIDNTGRGDVHFLFLDPDLTTAQTGGPAAADEMMERYLQLGGGGGILGRVRTQSIDLYLMEHPEHAGVDDNDSFMVTQTSPYGNLISGFFAFYDRSLRVWDFYAGMEDAMSWLQRNQLSGDVDPRTWVPATSLYQPVIDCLKTSTRCTPYTSAMDETLEQIIHTAPLGYLGVEDPAANEAPLPAPSRDSTETTTEADIGWQVTPRSGKQLYENLLRLSAVYKDREKEEGKGKPYSLGGMAERLTAEAGLAGAPFYATDLGCGPLHTELRERLLWQMERAYKRNIIGDSPASSWAMTVVNQSFAGAPGIVEVSARTPMRAGETGTYFIGMGTQAGEGAVVLPVRVRVGAGLPQFQGAARRDETAEPTGAAWSWAVGGDLGVGLRLPVDGRRPPVVMGPRAASLLTAGLGAHLVSLRNAGEGAVAPPPARNPAVWIPVDKETVSRQLQVTPFLRYTVMDVFFAEGRLYLGQESLSQAPPAGLGVGFQLRPVNFFSLREDGKR